MTETIGEVLDAMRWSEFSPVRLYADRLRAATRTAPDRVAELGRHVPGEGPVVTHRLVIDALRAELGLVDE